MGDFEGKIMAWMGPAVQALADAVGNAFQHLAAALRRFLLALFGGVAREDSAVDREAPSQAPDTSAARPAVELEDWQVVDRKPEPRWSTALVRQALQLTVAGKGLRSLHRENLPPEVLEWVAAVPADEVKDLLSLAPADLRAEYDLWQIGGEVLEALAEEAKPKPEDPEADPEPDQSPGGPRP